MYSEGFYLPRQLRTSQNRKHAVPSPSRRGESWEKGHARQSESALELLKMIFYLNASLGPKALQHACIEVWTCWISTQTEKIRVGQEIVSTRRTPPAPSAPTWCFPCVMMWMLGTDPRRQRGEWWGHRTLDLAAIGSALKFFLQVALCELINGTV